MEKLDFHALLLQAWHASMTRRLPLIFAAVMAIANLAENRLLAGVPAAASPQELLQTFSAFLPRELLLLFLILFALLAIDIFGKSNLIVSLSHVAGRKNLPNAPHTLRSIGRNFFRALVLEGIALLALLAAIGILALPLLIASFRNPETMSLLINMSVLTFIPIAVVIFFIKQYSLLYLLLSPVSIRGAIETGSALFSRFIFPSFLFGVFSLTLTALFTFCTHLVIVSMGMLLRASAIPFTETALALGVDFVSFTWFAVFNLALWIAFFKAIASTPAPEKTVPEKTLADNLPDTPPA